MFLCIHLPFGMWFFKVPNHSLFASQKKRDLFLFLLSSMDYIGGNVILQAKTMEL
jgi:hypothetical protein